MLYRKQKASPNIASYRMQLVQAPCGLIFSHRIERGTSVLSHGLARIAGVPLGVLIKSRRTINPR